MDFVTGFPRTPRKYDSVWDIVDRLTKSTHFLPVRTTYSTEDYARLYLKEIVRLHGLPTAIISDSGAQFTANFWRSFQEGLGTQVSLSTIFHPQTDGQAELSRPNPVGRDWYPIWVPVPTYLSELRSIQIFFSNRCYRIRPIQIRHAREHIHTRTYRNLQMSR